LNGIYRQGAKTRDRKVFESPLEMLREIWECGSPLPLLPRKPVGRERQRAAALPDAGAPSGQPRYSHAASALIGKTVSIGSQFGAGRSKRRTSSSQT